MGAEESALTAEEVEEIRNECPQFSVKNIKRLFKRFCKIDREHHGFINQSDILHLPEFAMNPLRNRIIDLFPSSDSRLTNFKQFCQGLSVFHPKAPIHVKLLFLFKLYDVDNDKRISRSDIETILKLAGGKFIEPEKIQEHALCVLCGHESLDFEEFCSVCNLCPPEEVSKKLSMSFEKSL